jgi:hypothetical protein
MALSLRGQEFNYLRYEGNYTPPHTMHGATPSLPHVFKIFCSPNTNSKTVQTASGTTPTKIALLTLTATERGDNGVQALTGVSH